VLRADERERLYSSSFKRTLAGYRAQEVFDRHAAQANTDDPLALIQYLDYKTWLVGDINTKVDRASMAHSLEVREPLMDHELVEWLATLPTSLKIQGQEGKWLFKKAFEPSLPEDVLYRPKMGFSVPLAKWLRGPLRQRLKQAVLGPLLQSTGYFEQQVLQDMVSQHLSGQRDHSAPLWTLLMFEAFLRQANGSAPTVSAASAIPLNV
jgi:asparagine synthase (glutamine-hydrolysing)